MNVELEDIKVCDLYMPNSREWDIEMLEELFFLEMLKKFAIYLQIGGFD